MNPKPDLNTSSRLTYAIAGALYFPIAFLLFYWINYIIGLWMGYPLIYYFRGVLLPCVNLKKFTETHPEVNLNNFFYIYLGALIAWSVIGTLLYRLTRKMENAGGRILQWLSVIMIVTPLYHVIIHLANTVFSVLQGDYHFYSRVLVYYLFFACFIVAAILVYRKTFKKEGRKKLWFISFPIFVLSWWLWFFEVGKYILP